MSKSNKVKCQMSKINKVNCQMSKIKKVNLDGAYLRSSSGHFLIRTKLPHILHMTYLPIYFAGERSNALAFNAFSFFFCPPRPRLFHCLRFLNKNLENWFKTNQMSHNIGLTFSDNKACLIQLLYRLFIRYASSYYLEYLQQSQSFGQSFEPA